MTDKQFYDKQISGGTNDVMRLVDCLERADIAWCAIGDVAVKHWAEHSMVILDVDFVTAAESVERVISLLEEAGFDSEKFECIVYFKGRSAVSFQLNTEDFYKDFSSRSVAADVHGILLRVASLEDTLKDKLKVLSEPQRRRSKKLKDIADIARLVETHPHLRDELTEELRNQIQTPKDV